MDDIFLSWGKPDRALIERMIERLGDIGMSVNEYSRREPAGETIPTYITDSINKARMVVAVVSVQALDHSSWVSEEITLAAGRLNSRDNRLEHLVLVRVGHVPDARLPAMLQPGTRRFLDIDHKPNDEQLETLIGELRRAFGQHAPLVIPAAIFSMTRAEFDNLRGPAKVRDPERIARLAALCQSAGMPEGPSLWQQLRGRYGDAPEDLAPYGARTDGTTHRLIDVAHDALRTVNEKRIRNQDRPLYLKWYSRSDFAIDYMRDRWRRGHSILIVDSLSALHDSISTSLERLPQPDSAHKSAVIYLPPYTSHNVQLEELIRHCLDGPNFLADTFRAWQQESERLGLAFDLATGTSLRRWLGQFLMTMETALEPDKENVSRMQQDRSAQPMPQLSGMPGG